LPAFLIAACFAKISLAQEIVAGENKKAPRTRQERKGHAACACKLFAARAALAAASQ
jgi:hypothetical protein